MKLDASILTQARQQYENTMTDENCCVRDPVITSFGMAMKLGGYVAVLEKSGCSILRSCPTCPAGKGNYSARYEKSGTAVWGCPHCQNITEQ